LYCRGPIEAFHPQKDYRRLRRSLQEEKVGEVVIERHHRTAVAFGRSKDFLVSCRAEAEVSDVMDIPSGRSPVGSGAARQSRVEQESDHAAVRSMAMTRPSTVAAAFGPKESTVEDALARAIEGAVSAGRWDIVAQPAKELEARRLAAPGVMLLADERAKRTPRR
jgi:hypothetical protein